MSDGGTAERRAKLSPERQALLAKRLRGLAESVEAGEEGPSPAAAPVAAPEELAALLAAEGPPPVGDELWEALVATGHREAARLGAEADLAADAAREPRLDRLAAAFVALAFQALGAFREAGEERSADGLIRDLGVLPKYGKVLRRWLETLAEEGLLERRGEAFAALEPLPPPALAALLSEQDRAYYGTHLPAVLTGETHPLEFYLPGGSSSSVESSYRELPIFRYCNGIARAVLEAQVAGLPRDGRLRMIEIGAGTGGTTASLLPVLPRERTLYVYTDVSKFFTDLGSRKFQEYPFLRYRELDIERDPGSQGFPPASFDWVVAAHVLHATRDIAETLENVRALLAPGGVLLLLEETRFQRKYHFSMGFLPGFDRFEDYELRPLHPLLPSARWGERLRAHGFEGFATFTGPGSAAEVMGVDVMLARLGPR